VQKSPLLPMFPHVIIAEEGGSIFPLETDGFPAKGARI
jgi:hypothetical protein